MIMFLANALKYYVRTVIESFLSPTLIGHFVYIGRGSRDLARQALFSLLLPSFLFVPPIFFCDKEQKRSVLCHNTSKYGTNK